MKEPNDAFLNFALAIEYVTIENDEKAKLIFENLVENDEHYFATYYHLGQLYERMNDEKKAIEIYKKGMEITQQLGEKHAFGELKSVLEELIY